MSKQDLERMEQACRALAFKDGQDAEAQAGNSVRDVALTSQQEFLARGADQGS